MKLALRDIIERLAQLAAGGDQRLTVPAEQARQLEGWLRELRARRIAMGREADDELNAPVDVCCCVPEDGSMAGWRWIKQKRDIRAALGGCPLHPGPTTASDEPTTT